ncbi:MAG: glycosyltransferase family 39 protein [Candidatus Coatesbacteria bacterium]|nr:glycosyltransferase family 39 protein [Candidatus Coatesbacteria bacterium]
MTLRNDYMVCLLLSAFWVVGNVIWLWIDDTSPVWDPAFHILDSIEASEAISSLDFARLLRLGGSGTFYPPLFHITAGMMMLVFGRSVDVAIGANLLFIPVLLMGLYYIGARLFDRQVGILAACLGTLLPGLWGVSRTAYLDFALASAVAAFIALLLVPDCFQRRDLCAAMGLVFGLGMLTKWTFVAYVAGPSALVLGRLLRRLTSKREGPSPQYDSVKRATASVILFVVAAGVVCLPWYVMNLAEILGYVSRCDVDFRESCSERGFSELLAFYLHRLATDQIFVPCLLMALIGLLLSIKRKWSLLFLLSWVAIPPLLFSLIAFRDHRYMVPILPGLAVSAAVCLRWMFRRKSLGCVAVLVIVSLFSSWLTVSFGSSPRCIALRLRRLSLPVWGCIAQDVRPAMAIGYPYEQLLRQLCGSSAIRTKAFVLPCSVGINPWTLRLESRLRRIDGVDFVFRDSADSIEEHLTALLTSEFIICKDGRQGEPPFDRAALVLGGLLLDRLRTGRIALSLVRRVPLPDGSSAYILGPNRISHRAAVNSRGQWLEELRQLERPTKPERLVIPHKLGVLRSVPPVLRWTPVPNALWYVVHIRAAGLDSEVRVCGEQITFAQQQADLMAEGKYTIEVAAANPKGQSDWLRVEFVVNRD